MEVYVVGYCEDGYCVFDTGSAFKGNKDPNKFRPIRCEEDKAVEEMEKVFREAESANLRGLMRALCRAGYRKTGVDA